MEAIVEPNSRAPVVGVNISTEQIDLARQHRARENVTLEIANAKLLVSALPNEDYSTLKLFALFTV